MYMLISLFHISLYSCPPLPWSINFHDIQGLVRLHYQHLTFAKHITNDE